MEGQARLRTLERRRAQEPEDDQRWLNDYPSARFRNVHARIVRSVYASDEGQSNKVPWTHRGGPILVFCGEINAKNRMGGYGGWQAFAFQPAQTDMVTLYDYGKPRRPIHVNIAAEDELRIAGREWYNEERVRLLCASSDDVEQIDPSDLSDLVKHPGA